MRASSELKFKTEPFPTRPAPRAPLHAPHPTPLPRPSLALVRRARTALTRCLADGDYADCAETLNALPTTQENAGTTHKAEALENAPPSL